MNSDDLQISKSCETYILHKTPFLISAFPGYIVFGETLKGQSYIHNKSIKIKYLEFNKLIVCITKFLEFVALEQKDTEKTLLSEEEHKTQLWQAFSTKINTESYKFLKFIIICESVEKELIFSLIEFNNFILMLRRCIIASLCLKDDEDELFILELIKKDEEFIITSKNCYRLAFDFVQNYLSSKCLDQKKSSFIELLRYHNEVILILKNLHEIFVEEDPQTN
jgi:hypothetical protein